MICDTPLNYYDTEQGYMPQDDPKGGGNKIITTDKSDNKIGPSTDIECCCGRSFTTVKGMRIHRTKMGFLSWQLRKSQPEISKSSEGNHSQENYHSTTVPFGCQPNVKKNAIRINWPKANNTKWKILDEELSFILRTSLNGPILSQILCVQCV